MPAITRLLRGLALALCSVATGAAVIAADPARQAAEAPPAPEVQASTRDMGNHLCAPHPAYCADLWRAGLAGGSPFNVLISEVCLHVRIRESEHAGIACVERAIGYAPSLPVSALVWRQFSPGERERNAIWHDKTDAEWGSLAVRYLRVIPARCDNMTPVIFDYFPCLLREVQYFQSVLKRYRLRSLQDPPAHPNG